MWELIFMMLILKIPIVYLCLVVYWAVKAKPDPLEPAPLAVAPVDDDSPSVRRPRRGPRRPRRGPHGSPGRRYVRTRRAVTR